MGRPLINSGAAHAFKVAYGDSGLRRSDRLVAYCQTFGDCQEVAARVLARLGGCPAQGVPFTASLHERGLISWGMDPPTFPEYEPGLSETGSWRSWLTERLALALSHAKRAPTAENPRLYALRRVSLLGIDTSTWAPRDDFWHRLETGKT